ncbi:MAG: hypothetical protein WC319_05100 [Candidatus Paceibacterota bacterium]|jgi:dolichol kinase
MLSLILFITTLLFFLIVIEILSRKYLIKPTISRKISHVGAAILVYLMPIFLMRDEIIIIGLFFALLLFFTRRTSIFSSIHSVQRKTFGEVFLPLGVILCALLFVPENIVAFQFGILIMGISDALASLVGEKFGNHTVKIFGHKKSIEGCLMFFISSLLIVYLFTQRLDFSSLIVVTILTGVELLLVLGLDNLILPIVGAYLIQFLL